MTRYELAKRIGAIYPTIDNIYKDTSIKFEILKAICNELDCLPIEILTFDEPNMKECQNQRLLAFYDTIGKKDTLKQYCSNINKSDTSE